ncbi:MAG: hypothetical protein ABR979_03035 [Halobacteriota archaeon]|jgi:hypothetical protein
MANRDIDYCNALGIPKEIPDEQGTLEFNLENSNLGDISISRVCIFDIQRSVSRFMLYRDQGSNLTFIHWNVNTGIRAATVSLQGLRAREWLYVAVTWSKEEISLSVGDLYIGGLRTSRGELQAGTVMLEKDGILSVVGDKGVEVAYVRITRAGEEVLSSNAWQTWDLTLKKVSKLFEGFSLSSDYFFKSTLAQQCLVMLVTGFEVYTKERFSEIERFKLKQANTDKLLLTFDKKKRYESERHRFIAKGGTLLESILEVPEGKGIINFQNWNKCKLAYNKGYNIVFGELRVRGQILRRLRYYFEYRHKIIHSKYEINCLNSDRLATEKPQYLYDQTLSEGQTQVIEIIRDEFSEFITALHGASATAVE